MPGVISLEVYHLIFKKKYELQHKCPFKHIGTVLLYDHKSFTRKGHEQAIRKKNDFPYKYQ